MFTVQLAGINIQICSVFSQTKMAFVDFLTNEKYKYCINITMQRIEFERETLQNIYPHKTFEDVEIEINTLYREIPKVLIKENVILLHGVLIAMEQKGYIFTAPSGTGKSTHAMLWKKFFGERVDILNGDKPLLKLSKDGVYAYGSPWKGKEMLGSNNRIKLYNICNLQRGSNNCIEKVDFDAKSLFWLIEQTQIKGLESTIINRIRWFKDAARFISLYDLKCNISEEAVKVAFSGMNR